MAGQAGGIGQRITQVVDAAFAEIGKEVVAGGIVDGRETVEAGIGMAVTGQDRQGDAFAAADIAEPLDAIGPVALAAEQPHDHQLRMADDPVDIKIDGIGMAELQQAGQPQ